MAPSGETPFNDSGFLGAKALYSFENSVIERSRYVNIPDSGDPEIVSNLFHIHPKYWLVVSVFKICNPTQDDDPNLPIYRCFFEDELKPPITSYPFLRFS